MKLKAIEDYCICQSVFIKFFESGQTAFYGYIDNAPSYLLNSEVVKLSTFLNSLCIYVREFNE